MTELYIGLMSGTSVDSIDSVLINFDNNNFEILEVSSSSIEKTLKDRIFNEVNKDKITYASIPEKYEAGTMPTAEVIAFNESIITTSTAVSLHPFYNNIPKSREFSINVTQCSWMGKQGSSI